MTLTLEQIAQRAELADNTPIDYHMGAGASHASAPHPWAPYTADGITHARGADCSAFVCHSSGVDKNDNGKWWNTDAIVADAKGKRTRWEQIFSPVRGCTVVYPGRKRDDGTWSPGHCGIVADPANRATLDCASTPFHAGGDAITRRKDLSFFWRNEKAIFCKPVGAV